MLRDLSPLRYDFPDVDIRFGTNPDGTVRVSLNCWGEFWMKTCPNANSENKTAKEVFQKAEQMQESFEQHQIACIEGVKELCPEATVAIFTRHYQQHGWRIEIEVTHPKIDELFKWATRRMDADTVTELKRKLKSYVENREQE